MIQNIAAENPSCLAMAHHRKTLCSVAEFGTDGQRNPLGRIVSLRRNPGFGHLENLNSYATFGTWPCHVSISVGGRHLLDVNCRSGSVVVFALHLDGTISERRDNKASTRAGSDQGRQSGPHAHSIGVDGKPGIVLGADPGTDAVHTRTLCRTTGALHLSKTLPCRLEAAAVRDMSRSIRRQAAIIFLANYPRQSTFLLRPESMRAAVSLQAPRNQTTMLSSR